MSAAAAIPSASSPVPGAVREKETPKQAAIGLIISFVMVLAFRGFCFETFHIPTGSMAPTLNGQHLRLRSAQTGAAWAVNPWDEYWIAARQRGFTPPGGFGTINITEPVSNLRQVGPAPTRAGGDRIGIVKYNPLYRPRRWDVVVMRWPSAPDENYIKRLVGMPGERLWFADGDVFVADAGAPADKPGAWRIARKPDAVQRAVWWTEFSSEQAPIDRAHDGRAWTGPWTGEGWDLSGRSYTHAGQGPATLRWDSERWPITDWASYNDVPMYRDQMRRFPVSDVRVRFGVAGIAGSPNVGVSVTVSARSHAFRAVIDAGAAKLQMRAEGSDGPWQDLSAPVPVAIHPDRVTDVEFWHVDQALSLHINGSRVARHEYDWSPEQRLAFATGMPADQLAPLLAQTTGNPLANPAIYRPVGIAIAVTGPATLHRVGVDRDLHYQAAEYRTGAVAGKPALGTHPLNLPALTPEEYFFCGDNSANSTDSRLVDTVDPWVANRFDARLGVVHERLIKGKALMVFWPAAHPVPPLPAAVPFPPDVGRMRWIR